MIHVIDAHDDATWPPAHQWYQVMSPGGWSVNAVWIDGPFVLMDGESRSTLHQGVLVLGQLKLIALTVEAFASRYTRYPKEWF